MDYSRILTALAADYMFYAYLEDDHFNEVLKIAKFRADEDLSLEELWGLIDLEQFLRDFGWACIGLTTE